MIKKAKKATKVMETHTVMTALRKDYGFTEKMAEGTIYAISKMHSAEMKRLATKEDIASLAKRMDLMELDLANVKEHIGETRKDIHQFKSDIREDMDDMRREIKEDMDDMRREIKEDRDDMRREIKEDRDDMKREIKEYIREFTGGLIKNLMWCLTLIFGVMTGILVMIVTTIFGG